MGVNTRRPILPAPTESIIDTTGDSATGTDLACSVVLDRGEDEGSVVGVMTVAPRFLARWGRTGFRGLRWYALTSYQNNS
jgi:hypothetical protein